MFAQCSFVGELIPLQCLRDERQRKLKHASKHPEREFNSLPCEVISIKITQCIHSQISFFFNFENTKQKNNNINTEKPLNRTWITENKYKYDFYTEVQKG